MNLLIGIEKFCHNPRCLPKRQCQDFEALGLIDHDTLHQKLFAIHADIHYADDLLDLSSTLIRLMVICGIHFTKAREASRICTEALLNYDVVRDRKKYEYHMELRKEQLCSELGNICRMNCKETEVAYNLIKRGFKTYYHTSKSQGRNFQMPFEQSVFMYVARRTAQYYIKYRGLTDAEKEHKLERRIIETYRKFYRRMHQRRCQRTESDSRKCRCSFCEQSGFYSIWSKTPVKVDNPLKPCLEECPEKVRKFIHPQRIFPVCKNCHCSRLHCQCRPCSYEPKWVDSIWKRCDFERYLECSRMPKGAVAMDCRWPVPRAKKIQKKANTKATNPTTIPSKNIRVGTLGRIQECMENGLHSGMFEERSAKEDEAGRKDYVEVLSLKKDAQGTPLEMKTTMRKIETKSEQSELSSCIKKGKRRKIDETTKNKTENLEKRTKYKINEYMREGIKTKTKSETREWIRFGYKGYTTKDETVTTLEDAKRTETVIVTNAKAADGTLAVAITEKMTEKGDLDVIVEKLKAAIDERKQQRIQEARWKAKSKQMEEETESETWQKKRREWEQGQPTRDSIERIETMMKSFKPDGFLV